MKISVWVFTSETIEERAGTEQWTADDFVAAYNNRTTLEPFAYDYFATEEEAMEAWRKEEADGAYRQRGYISELIFFNVLELERREYDVDEIPTPLTKEKLQDIVENNDIVDLELIDTKISDSEEEEEEEDEEEENA